MCGTDRRRRSPKMPLNNDLLAMTLNYNCLVFYYWLVKVNSRNSFCPFLRWLVTWLLSISLDSSSSSSTFQSSCRRVVFTTIVLFWSRKWVNPKNSSGLAPLERWVSNRYADLPLFYIRSPITILFSILEIFILFGLLHSWFRVLLLVKKRATSCQQVFYIITHPVIKCAVTRSWKNEGVGGQRKMEERKNDVWLDRRSLI